MVRISKEKLPYRRDVLIRTAATVIMVAAGGSMTAKAKMGEPTKGPFNGRKGVNITAPFVGPSVQNGHSYFPDAYRYHRDVFHQLKTWDQFKAVGHLKRIKAAGFDHARLVIDPGPLVLARSESRWDAYQRYKSKLLRAIGDVLDSGLFVMVNLHPQRDNTSPINWHNTIGGGTSNALYLAYRFVASELAAALVSTWDTDRVCIEPYNEPAPAHDHDIRWSARCQDMHAAIRTAAGHDLTVVWGPDTWYDWKRLSEFKASDFDSRTSWAFHAYEPRPFTYQGYPRTLSDSPHHYITGLEFPPNTQALGNAISAAMTRIDGDEGLDARQKIHFKNVVRKDLRSYYRIYKDASSFEKNVLAPVVHWAEREGLPGDRIFCNEFGVNRDWPTDWSRAVGSITNINGAKLEDRIKYLKMVVGALESKQFRWTCFDWCGPDFGLTSLDGNFTLLPGVASAMGVVG